MNIIVKILSTPVYVYRCLLWATIAGFLTLYFIKKNNKAGEKFCNYALPWVFFFIEFIINSIF